VVYCCVGCALSASRVANRASLIERRDFHKEFNGRDAEGTRISALAHKACCSRSQKRDFRLLEDYSKGKFENYTFYASQFCDANCLETNLKTELIASLLGCCVCLSYTRFAVCRLLLLWKCVQLFIN
jgi:hypothetical protein